MTDDIDLAYQQALAAERARLRPDPGTTLGYPTLRKGIVTHVDPSVQVDGAPASNITGIPLAVDDVVWMLVDAGRRFVIGPTARYGLYGYAEHTSNVGSITTTAVDLVETTVQLPPNRRVKVTGSWGTLVSTVAGDRVVVRIVDPNEQRRHTALVGTSGGSGAIPAYLTPPAGARTYKLQAFRDAGSGTVIVGASAITPIYIAVEDAGPA